MLKPKLADAGILPPLDPANSLTRIGVGTSKKALGSVSAPALRKVATRLRLELANAQDQLKFSSDGTDAKSKQFRRARAWRAALYQPAGEPRCLGDQVLALLAVSKGLLDDTATDDEESLRKITQDLVAHARSTVPEMLDLITESRDITPAASTHLEKVASDFLEGALAR